jgi:hypothetical protein
MTDFLLPAGQLNTVNFKIIKSPVPLMMAVRECELLTIASIGARITGMKDFDSTVTTVLVKGTKCMHEDPFEMIEYLVRAIAASDWFCPVCGNVLAADRLVVATIEI